MLNVVSTVSRYWDQSDFCIHRAGGVDNEAAIERSSS